MKRKLIQLAGKTLVVSLPSKWVAMNNVQKGQEIDVRENGRQLVLTTDAEPRSMRAEFDTRGQGDRAIRLAISGLHKEGYDEIDLIYSDPKTIALIQDLVRDFFLGFIITGTTKVRCTIRGTSRDTREEYDSALRRAFLVTISLGENIHDALKSHDFSSLTLALDLEKTNNLLTGYCQRILNRSGAKEASNTCFSYVLTWNLEKVCDEYKYLIRHLLGHTEGQRASPELICLSEETLSYLQDLYGLLYRPEPSRISGFVDKGAMLAEKAQGLIASSKPSDRVIAAIFSSLIVRISDFLSLVIPLTRPNADPQ